MSANSRACMRSGSPAPYSSCSIAHQRGLGRPVQPGDHPSLRVGLLEVVERAVHDVLAQLPELAVAGRCHDGPRALDRLDEQRVELARHAVARPSPAGTSARRAAWNTRSTSRRSASSPGSHSRSSVDAGEAAVVQLVAAVEGELEVVAVGVGVGRVGPQGRLVAQGREHGGRDRPAGVRERRRINARWWGAAEHGSPRRSRSRCSRVGIADLAAVAGVAEGCPAAAPAHAQRRDRPVGAHAAAVGQARPRRGR